MTICHIWDADYPWDVRVEKICDSLATKHDVHLVCRNAKRLPRYQRIKSVHIHRLPFFSVRFGGLNDLIGFPAFINPLWIYTVWRTVKRTKADLIVVRDLPLALTAIGIGRLLGVPVLLDMAENYPAMIQDLWDRQGFSMMNFLVRNPAVIRLVERCSVRWSDHILAVVEESRERLLSIGVPATKVSLVINTPTLTRWAELEPSPDRFVSRELHQMDLVYLGLLEWARGLETAIRAVDLVRQHIPWIRFLVVGSGRHEEDFRALVGRLQLERQVQFLGWLDYEAAIRVIQRADIGLVPHYATESWNTTVPNKLFDYMSMGKPVIVSNAKPTERIVREERCGLVFAAQDPHDLAKAILELNQPEAREQMGRRGQEAVATKYNWTIDEQRLLMAVEATACKKEP
jgi:glycosyltransferase involved in cell wall biosynthesis